jgi:hypothetical protein
LEDLQEPGGKVAIEVVAALVKTVTAAGVEDEAFGVARRRVELGRATRGENFIPLPMDQEERPRGESRDDGDGSVGLTAERGDGDGFRGRRCRVDGHRAAKGMAHQHHAVDAERTDELRAGEHVFDAWLHLGGPAVIDLERGDAFGLELAREALIDAARGTAETSAGSEDPDDSGIAGRGAVETAAHARECEIFRVVERRPHAGSVAHQGPQ